MLPKETVLDALAPDSDDQDVSNLLNAGADAGAGDAGRGGSSGGVGDGEAAAGRGLTMSSVPPAIRQTGSALDSFSFLSAADVREEVREELKVFASGSLRAELCELSVCLRRDMRRVLDEMLPRDVMAALGKQLLVPSLQPTGDNGGGGSGGTRQSGSSQASDHLHPNTGPAADGAEVGVAEYCLFPRSENSDIERSSVDAGDVAGAVGAACADAAASTSSVKFVAGSASDIEAAANGASISTAVVATGFASDSESGLNSKIKLELQALMKETLGTMQSTPRLQRLSNESFFPSPDMSPTLNGLETFRLGKKKKGFGPMRTFVAATAFEQYDVEGDYYDQRVSTRSTSSSGSFNITRSAAPTMQADRKSQKGGVRSRLNRFFKRRNSESRVSVADAGKLGTTVQLVPAVGAPPSAPTLQQPVTLDLITSMQTPPPMPSARSMESFDMGETRRLKVTVRGAKNLRNAELPRSAGDLVEMCCACRVKSKASSEWKTQPASDTSNPRWDACKVIDHWEPGDSLEFIIGDTSSLDQRDFIARAFVHSSKFEDIGFEGELPLRDPNGKVVKFGALGIKLELLNLKGTGSLSKLEEEDDEELLPEPLAAVAKRKAESKVSFATGSEVTMYTKEGILDLCETRMSPTVSNGTSVSQKLGSSTTMKDRHNRKQVFLGGAQKTQSFQDRQRQTKAEDERELHWSSKLRNGASAIVESTAFDVFTGLLILLNAVWIGVQTQASAERGDESPPDHFAIVDSVFAIAFTAELALRLFCHRLAFFYMKGSAWNIFDFFLVITNLVEEITSRAIKSGAGTNFSFMRALRILRLIRVVRLVRIVRLIGELRTIVCSIGSSLKSLVWTVLLLSLLIYVVGIYFTQLVADHGDGSDDLTRYFGSLGRTILTLFEAVTGGLDWDNMASPLAMDIHPFCALLFVVYIAFAVLAMLNVVTGVFVESALMTARYDKDVDLVNQLREVFVMSDTDCTGMMSHDEFHQCIHEPQMCAVFKAIDLDVSEAEGLFELIDVEDIGEISREEFIMGCLRLKGQAKALDLATLMYDHKRVANMLEDHMHWVESCLSSLV